MCQQVKSNYDMYRPQGSAAVNQPACDLLLGPVHCPVDSQDARLEAAIDREPFQLSEHRPQQSDGSDGWLAAFLDDSTEWDPSCMPGADVPLDVSEWFAGLSSGHHDVMPLLLSYPVKACIVNCTHRLIALHVLHCSVGVCAVGCRSNNAKAHSCHCI